MALEYLRFRDGLEYVAETQSLFRWPTDDIFTVVYPLWCRTNTLAAEWIGIDDTLEGGKPFLVKSDFIITRHPVQESPRGQDLPPGFSIPEATRGN